MDDVTASIIIACQTAGAVNSISKLGFALGMLGKQAGEFFLQFSKDSLKSFNLAQDASWKFGKTFRNSMGTATRSVREFMNEYNLSEKTAKSMLTDTASILKGFGFSEKDALKMSEQVSRMGIDLASFTGAAGGAQEAVSSITSALTGETERMKKYGTVIRMDDKALVSLTKTIQKNKGVSETQARAMAILQEIIKQNTDAIGDYKAEGENWTQAQNNQKEAISQLQQSFGEMLYKLFDIYETTEKITEIIKDITNWVNQEVPSIVFAIKSFWLSVQEGAESCMVVLNPVFSGIIAGFKNIVNAGQWMYDNWDRIFRGMSKSETNFLHGLGKDFLSTTKNAIVWTKDSGLAFMEFFNNIIGWNKLLYGQNQNFYQTRSYNSMIKTISGFGSDTEKTLARLGTTKFPTLETPDYSAWINFTKTQDNISKKYSSKRSKMELDFEKWMDTRKKQEKDNNEKKEPKAEARLPEFFKSISDEIFKLRSATQSAVFANSVDALRLQSRVLTQSPEMKVQQSQLDTLKQIKNGIDRLVGPTRTAPTMVRS